jgi:hypothetical protein
MQPFFVGVTALLVALSASGTAASAMTGTQWSGLSESARGFYVLGVLEGWALAIRAVQAAAPDENAVRNIFGTITGCVAKKRMTGEQVTRTVGKYMADHRLSWHRDMAFLVREALQEVC